MQAKPLYRHVVDHFSSKPLITLATGATCAYLGDERNLREHLVSDEVARHLRSAGHTVVHFLIDDNLDPLNFRQLRVAVNKDPELIERYQSWCGRPIAYLPDPWGCCESYAAHFEEALLNRLHYVGCHPTLIRVSKSYERGLYADAVRTVLQNQQKIVSFLQNRFPDYIPEKLFWPICPFCHYIDATRVEKVEGEDVTVSCSRCQNQSLQPASDIPGKLNWKLDCAARWSIFNIDSEAFSQPYLEPHVGSYHIAQALNQEFFGGKAVLPLNYGLVKMENKMGGKLIDGLPASLLRQLFVDQPVTDIKLSGDFIVVAASRHEVLSGFTYLDFVKQVLPIWLLTPYALTWEQRELVKHGISFGKEFLKLEVHPQLPQRSAIESSAAEILSTLSTLLQQTVAVREQPKWLAAKPGLGDTEAGLVLQEELQQCIDELGSNKIAVLRRFRAIVGQKQGLPVTKLLLLLPLDYLNLLQYLITLFLRCSSISPHETDEVSAENVSKEPEIENH